MIRSLILSLFISLFSSCVKKTSPSPTINQGTGQKTYLALGDSYTIGQSVSTSERFPMQTVEILRKQSIIIADPLYIAQTGWTTTDLHNALKAQTITTHDIVTLLIGVNDQYQRMDTAGYANRFTILLEISIAAAKGKKSNVFVLSIPDYSVTPFVSSVNKARVRMEVDWFNTINKRITLAYGVSYTDITPSTREAETNRALIANDSLHPSGLEYKKWAEMLAPKVKEVLQ